jgi:DNA mismatch repair protein MSH5
MAIDIKDKGKVGCAYYVAGEERLICMEEVIGGGSEIVEKCEYPAVP